MDDACVDVTDFDSSKPARVDIFPQFTAQPGLDLRPSFASRALILLLGFVIVCPCLCLCHDNFLPCSFFCRANTYRTQILEQLTSETLTIPTVPLTNPP